MAKLEDNKVVLKTHGLTGVEFHEIGHSVSEGEPWEGIKSYNVSPDGYGVITIASGRHKTSPVATWFRNEISTGYAFGNLDESSYPGELNFAIKGQLRLSFSTGAILTCEIILAQGHFGTHNNWWIGSDTMVGAGTSLVRSGIQVCEEDGSEIFQVKPRLLFNSTLDSNEFEVEFIEA